MDNNNVDLTILYNNVQKDIVKIKLLKSTAAKFILLDNQIRTFKFITELYERELEILKCNGDIAATDDGLTISK